MPQSFSTCCGWCFAHSRAPIRLRSGGVPECARSRAAFATLPSSLSYDAASRRAKGRVVFQQLLFNVRCLLAIFRSWMLNALSFPADARVFAILPTRDRPGRPCLL
jgi:hypothetical protein